LVENRNTRDQHDRECPFGHCGKDHSEAIVSSLDQWLATHKVNTVDFIKLDVEGGELSVLQGAAKGYNWFSL
jgi:FkbM family methyltransferase